MVGWSVEGRVLVGRALGDLEEERRPKGERMRLANCAGKKAIMKIERPVKRIGPVSIYAFERVVRKVVASDCESGVGGGCLGFMVHYSTATYPGWS